MHSPDTTKSKWIKMIGKNVFITHKEVFAYCNMPFGLMNAEATFEKIIDEIFGQNMEVYIDDMIVKSKKRVDDKADLRESFETIRRHKMKLNLTKCSFGLTSGNFLGFLLTQQGIEVDPKQIKAIQDITSPTTLKEVQILTGCIAALRRFIP